MTGDQFSGVDLDLLADYVGGALTGTPEEAEVASLIADDPAWQVAHDELAAAMASVGADLNALGAAPEPMPAALVLRLESSFTSAVTDPGPIDPELAAPVTPRVVKPGTGVTSGRHLSAVPDDGVDPGDRLRPTATGWRRSRRWAAPIAAAAAVITFAGLGIDYLTGRSDSSSDEATSAAAGSANRYEGNSPMMASAQARAMDGGVERTATGIDYQRATLGITVPKAAFQADNDSKSASVPGPAIAPDLQRLALADALQACLDAIAHENAAGVISPQVIDFARFEGSPAVIVRFSAANGSWVWAAGPDCGAPGVGAAKLSSVRVG